MRYRDERNDRHVSELNDLPKEEHYVVLTEESFSYDDGYGEGPNRGPSYSTHRSLSYRVFHDVDALKKWIVENDESTYGKKTYRILHVRPCTIAKQVTINVDIE